MLPVFSAQRTPGADARDATQPLDAFARHATLASVTVEPDTDGRVRRISTVRPGIAGKLPAMAVVLGGAGRAGGGVIGKPLPTGQWTGRARAG